MKHIYTLFTAFAVLRTALSDAQYNLQTTVVKAFNNYLLHIVNKAYSTLLRPHNISCRSKGVVIKCICQLQPVGLLHHNLFNKQLLLNSTLSSKISYTKKPN